jgi:hypothetical protein
MRSGGFSRQAKILVPVDFFSNNVAKATDQHAACRPAEAGRNG